VWATEEGKLGWIGKAPACGRVSKFQVQKGRSVRVFRRPPELFTSSKLLCRLGRTSMAEQKVGVSTLVGVRECRPESSRGGWWEREKWG